MTDSIQAPAASGAALRDRIMKASAANDIPVTLTDSLGSFGLLAVEMGFQAGRAYEAAKKTADPDTVDYELLLPFAIITQQGEPVFTLDDVAALGQIGRSMVAPLVDAARRANGIN